MQIGSIFLKTPNQITKHQSLPKFRSLLTCYNRLPKNIQSLVLAGDNFKFCPRFRSVCMKLEDREINAIANLCNNPKIKNKGKYFAKIVSRNNLEGTLTYVRRVLKRNIEAMRYLAQKITTEQCTLCWMADKISGKYSMKNVVDMVEIALKKKQPDRYLIGILKKGYVPYQKTC